jgi:hypothetical protein
LQLVVDLIESFKLTLFASIQLLDMLLDLYKALFVLRQYRLLVLVLGLEQSALMLGLGQSFALVLQLRLALPQDLLQLLLPVHGDLLQL